MTAAARAADGAPVPAPSLAEQIAAVEHALALARHNLQITAGVHRKTQSQGTHELVVIYARRVTALEAVLVGLKAAAAPKGAAA